MSARRTVGVLAGTAVGLAGVVALGSGGHPQTADASSSGLVGHRAPPLTGTSLSGDPVRVHTTSRSVTVVNIWASWCGPCRQEVPFLAAQSRRWSRQGVRLVTVDTRDGAAAARTLLHEVGAEELPTIMDPTGRSAVAWGVTGVPETFVLDRHGVIRAHWAGSVGHAWLRRQVERWRAS